MFAFASQKININPQYFAASTLQNVTVEVGLARDSMAPCTHYNGPAAAEEWVTLECVPAQYGQYVRISGGGHSEDAGCDVDDYLALCEVLVHCW